MNEINTTELLTETELNATTGGNGILIGVGLALVGWTAANWADIKQGWSDACNLK